MAFSFLPRFLLSLALLSAVSTQAATPIVRDEIQRALEDMLDPLATQKTWSAYVDAHPTHFPTPQLYGEDLITVEPVELKTASGTITVGLAYRQSVIHASLKRIDKILSSPAIFQDLYGLDGESIVLDAPLRARIFKKVPVFSNQDYTLDYETHVDGDDHLTRAKLVDDKKRFAARDNLIVLAPITGGTLFREISAAYIRSAFLRMLGPQVRSVTKSELKKISESLRCFAEKDPESLELKHSDAKACWTAANH